MARDPWQRASELNRLNKQRQSRGSSGAPPPRLRRGPRPLAVVLIVCVVLLVGAAVAGYFTRGWWLPRYRDQLPEPVVDAVQQVAPEPPVSIDWVAVETGLGAQLTPFHDYLRFTGQAAEWGAELKLVVLGEDAVRLTAPGVTVSTRDGLIWTYLLELDRIFADERWAEWVPELEAAGLSPYTTWTALLGGDDPPAGNHEELWRSDRGRQLPGGWVHPVYVLHFHDGWLRRLELRVDFGASTSGKVGKR
jgi:hypothetical protein